MADSAPRIFVNAPLDDDYRSQFNAIVLTCVYAGFEPVVASSSGRTGRPRLERILAELNACRYSVHDLLVATERATRTSLGSTCRSNSAWP